MVASSLNPPVSDESDLLRMSDITVLKSDPVACTYEQVMLRALVKFSRTRFGVASKETMLSWLAAKAVVNIDTEKKRVVGKEEIFRVYHCSHPFELKNGENCV